MTKEKRKLELSGSGVIPRPYSERTVTPVRMAAIWFAMAICITLFIESARLFESLCIRDIIITLVVAHTLLCMLMWLTQDIGIKYGIPFSVSLRPSFGYVGMLLPTFFRAIPGIFWFGFQTWVGAEAMNALTETVWGYSNINLFIILLGAVQVVHTCFGIKAVSRLSNFTSPLLLFVGLYILYVLLTENKASFGEILDMKGEGGDYNMMSGILMYIGGWITMALSISDLTRECTVPDGDSTSWWKSTKRMAVAQWLGLVPATVLFGLIGAIGVAFTGEWNPIRMMVAVIGPSNPVMMVLCLLFVLLATWATNDTGNLYPAAYAFVAAWPKKITFARGVILAGVLGLVVQPWKAADGLLDVITFIGCLLAPISGILIVDYYVLRKRKLNMDDLYNSEGQYKYWNNINPAAIIALIAGLVCSLPFWSYVFFVGLAVGGVVYYVLMKCWILKKYPQSDIQ